MQYLTVSSLVSKFALLRIRSDSVPLVDCAPLLSIRDPSQQLLSFQDQQQVRRSGYLVPEVRRREAAFPVRMHQDSVSEWDNL